ncbi:uncharacterized protein [Dendropsophus ebraccatus]|uniref:uncharacterized protein n=1 Tax=Dendropsophus ebraccatus TaxID=150705 RepID=UPI0038316379
MEQSNPSASSAAVHPGILLLTVSKTGTVRIGLPPRNLKKDNYHARAQDFGELQQVSKVKHVLCSPEGELFCVRDGDLYRGPLPSQKDINWISDDKLVGKWEWEKFKILFFHPEGELHGTTNDGEYYHGPQPANENVPWMTSVATKRNETGWEKYEFLFFHPSAVLYKVKNNEVPQKKGKTCLEPIMLIFTKGKGHYRFFSFCPDEKLWSVDNQGHIYSGLIPNEGSYLDNAEKIGTGYNTYRFFSFTKDKTIVSFLSFAFLPEEGKIDPDGSCEVILKKANYHTKEISIEETFNYSETVTETSTFSHEHGFTFSVGADLTFKAGIPSIGEISTTVKVNHSTTHKWTFTKTNQIQKLYSSSIKVSVPPNTTAQTVASVKMAKMTVPYRAKVRTLFGLETEIRGTWKGSTVCNVDVKQENVNEKEFKCSL